MADHLDDLYRDILMEHYRFPRGDEDIEDPDLESAGVNPACGDEIDIKVKFDGNRVKKIGVHCIGCAISIASGSILAELVHGKSIDEIKKIAELVKAILKDEKIDEDTDLGDLEALRGVRKFPVRIKCALLSWTTLVDTLEAHEAGVENGATTKQ